MTTIPVGVYGIITSLVELRGCVKVDRPPVTYMLKDLTRTNRNYPSFGTKEGSSQNWNLGSIKAKQKTKK